MPTIARWRSLCFVALAATAACAAPPPPMPDAAMDAAPDVARDAAPDVTMDTAVARCARNEDCNDSLFCNGEETCEPSNSSANARGCVAASPACADGACDEAARMCRTSNDGGTDVLVDSGACDEDNDGHRSVACGGDDCDDNDRFRFPGNPERCEGMLDATTAAAGHDEDCNPCTVAGMRPDGDADDDGYARNACTNAWVGGVRPAGCSAMNVVVDEAMRTVRGGDCQDGPAMVMSVAARQINPGNPELCGNSVDDNCDGTTDNAGTTTWYQDLDGDGYGAAAMTVANCAPPATGGPWVSRSGDCNDSATNGASTFPGAPEQCDRRDNNCSSGGGAETSEDADGDGHSSASATCLGRGEAGASASALPKDDCDDARAETFAGAPEQCDRRDNNCSLAGALRGGVDATEDNDNDGRAPTAATCLGRGAAGAIATALPKDDCNDSAATTYPGAPELCDGLDNNCDGSADGTPANAACPSGNLCIAARCQVNNRLSAGGGHTCTLRSGGVVACWGRNYDGQNGNGTTTDWNSPYPVMGLTDAVEIAAGSTHTCARRGNGTVLCWGYNEFGGLGNNTTTNSHTPTAVVGVTDAIELTTSVGHTCVRNNSGGVLCWGFNSNNQLGDGTTMTRLVPTAVLGLTDAVEISAGGSHTCARRSSGAVLCWGNNSNGQLGDGTTVRRSAPTAVTGITDAVEISTGYNHTCVRRSGGAVLCWGYNNNGQLGDGTTVQRLVPTAVTGLTDAVSVSARLHTCARRSSGAIVCWGDNRFGQLGDGTTVQRLVPTAVTGIADVAEVTTGERHTCARRNDGNVLCWGDNDEGEVGDTTTVQRNVPTPVIDLPP